MHLRIFRATVDDLPGCQPQLSPLQADRRDRMVEAAGALLCRHGRESLTLRTIAAALRFTPTMVERHFPDLASLIGEVFTRHLQSIFAAMGKLPADAPDRQAARRVIYLNATRGAFGTYTAMHQLYVRERGALPDDIAQPLEQLRLAIGALVSREHGETVLNLLDIVTLEPSRIEAFVGLLEGSAGVAADVAPAYSPEPVLTEALIASMFRPDPRLEGSRLEGSGHEASRTATDASPRKAFLRHRQERLSASAIDARAGPANQAGTVRTSNRKKRWLELVSRQPV